MDLDQYGNSSPYAPLVRKILNNGKITVIEGKATLILWNDENHYLLWQSEQMLYPEPEAIRIIRIGLERLPMIAVTISELRGKTRIVGVAFSKMPDYSDLIIKYYAEITYNS